VIAVEIGRGAEAILTRDGDAVRKWRLPKSYRMKELDERLRAERTVMEARIMAEARRAGVPTPIIRDISRFELVMEYVDGKKLRDIITPELSERVGEVVGRLHRAGIVHGDLTTSNMLLKDNRIYLIDFGLAYHDQSIEAQGVDVHVYFQTLRSTHDDADTLIESFRRGYRRAYSRADAVLARVEEIRSRGRYL